MRIDKSVRVALVVAIAFFMQFLDTTAVNTAIPAMARAFGDGCYPFEYGHHFVPDRAGDFYSGQRLDRRPVRDAQRVLRGDRVFFLSSTLCGTSQSLLQFVIYRVMQGMAGAMMSPVGRLAVLKTSSKENLPVAMNYITIPALVAPIVGPLVGGYLTTFLTWRWIFYLNVPISIACVLLAWRYIPSEKRGEGSCKPFDAPGFVLSGLALAGFMYGVEPVQQRRTFVLRAAGAYRRKSHYTVRQCVLFETDRQSADRLFGDEVQKATGSRSTPVRFRGW